MQTQIQIFARIVCKQIQTHADDALTALKNRAFDDFTAKSTTVYALQQTAEAAFGCGILTAGQYREISFAVQQFRARADDLFALFNQT